ncbi:DUF2500 domain-containing protein [Tissierellaceae bacterium BX21]|uniref:DUF2500 domain-containing protein n=2 Tax=Paratissierella segnis TaxID=2763679 RepID=A0A926EUS5_9FIRM|nr:DUF2500 domain-containing protein [Paratissierella segnis]
MFSVTNFVDFIFPLFFLLFFGIIIYRIIQGAREWNSNNKQPILNVDAKIVSKRAHNSVDTHNHNGHVSSSTDTTYYVTFEVQSGDRLEFKVPSKEYGMLVEGDRGNLIFQGTRYHGFDREI